MEGSVGLSNLCLATHLKKEFCSCTQLVNKNPQKLFLLSYLKPCCCTNWIASCTGLHERPCKMTSFNLLYYFLIYGAPTFVFLFFFFLLTKQTQSSHKLFLNYFFVPGVGIVHGLHFNLNFHSSVNFPISLGLTTVGTDEFLPKLMSQEEQKICI